MKMKHFGGFPEGGSFFSFYMRLFGDWSLGTVFKFPEVPHKYIPGIDDTHLSCEIAGLLLAAAAAAAPPPAAAAAAPASVWIPCLFLPVSESCFFLPPRDSLSQRLVCTRRLSLGERNNVMVTRKCAGSTG